MVDSVSNDVDGGNVENDMESNNIDQFLVSVRVWSEKQKPLGETDLPAYLSSIYRVIPSAYKNWNVISCSGFANK